MAGKNAIAFEIRGPVVGAGQTAVVVDVRELGRVDLHHVFRVSQRRQDGLLRWVSGGAGSSDMVALFQTAILRPLSLSLSCSHLEV